MPVAYVKIYVGNEEDSLEDILYVDLCVGNKSVTLWFSKDLDGILPEKYVEIVESALECATYFSRNLDISLSVDIDILNVIEDSEPKYRNRIRKMVKEALHGIKS